MSVTVPTHPERRTGDTSSLAAVDRRLASGAIRRPTPPKGWYPDPAALRFWDGQAWTVFTKPAAVPTTTSAALPDLELHGTAPALTTVPVPTGEPRRTWRDLLVLLGVALLALGAGAAIAALGIGLTV